jgi:Protein of unknown function (DUF4238)
MSSEGKSTPKNHHFVAQMHAKRFTDNKGKLWAFNKQGDTIFRALPKAVFAETHLYTIEAADGNKDTSLESDLSQLEGDANFIIEKLVTAARSGRPPKLTLGERATWDMYFYVQWKRVPDVHAKVSSFTEADAFLDKIFAAMRARGPEVAAKVDDLDRPEERKRLIQGGEVHAIRKRPGKVLDVLGSRGLALLHIIAPGESFAIGSLPIVREQGDFREDDSKMWLPIASDVAVGPASPPGIVKVIDLNDSEKIWRMNEVTACQSTTFAASSKDLLEKLVAALPKR